MTNESDDLWKKYSKGQGRQAKTKLLPILLILFLFIVLMGLGVYYIIL